MKTLIALRNIGGFVGTNEYVIYDSSTNLISKISGLLSTGTGSMTSKKATPEQITNFANFANQFVNVTALDPEPDPTSVLYTSDLYVVNNNSVKTLSLAQYNPGDIVTFGGVNVTAFLQDFTS